MKPAPSHGDRGARTPSGSWRQPPEYARQHAHASAPPPRLTTDARLRRGSSLPRRLLWGRLVRGGALLGLAALAALGVVQVAAWVEKSDALPVRTVAVRGAGALAVDEILAYASVVPGQPLFAVDVDAVAQRVLEHPFVAHATVRRVPPDGIEIAVEARAPRAVLAAGRGLYLVDDKGGIMKAARAGDGLDLPVITGISAKDVIAGSARTRIESALSMIDLHEKNNAPGGAVSEVNAIAGVGFELVLEDGTRVRVGETGIDSKLERLGAVVERLAAEGRRASFIYLDDDRRPERASVRLRPEAQPPPAGG